MYNNDNMYRVKFLYEFYINKFYIMLIIILSQFFNFKYLKFLQVINGNSDFNSNLNKKKVKIYQSVSNYALFRFRFHFQSRTVDQMTPEFVNLEKVPFVTMSSISYLYVTPYQEKLEKCNLFNY